jgi:hypothetical protein
LHDALRCSRITARGERENIQQRLNGVVLVAVIQNLNDAPFGKAPVNGAASEIAGL